MSIIYMRHPRHGTKIATLEEEARADERNGWARFDPKAPVVGPSPPPPAAMNPVDPEAAPVRRRGGRPRKVV